MPNKESDKWNAHLLTPPVAADISAKSVTVAVW